MADKLVSEVFSRFCCPQQIHTDQGREFQSNLFSTLCKMFGIEKTRTTPYRPQSDGLVERLNRTQKQMLTNYANSEPCDWDDHLPYVLMAYRATEHKSTGCSPNLMMLGREANLPIDVIVGKAPESSHERCRIEYVEWLK